MTSRLGTDSGRGKNKNAADCKEAGGGLLLPLSNCILRYPEGPMVTTGVEGRSKELRDEKGEGGKRNPPRCVSLFLVPISTKRIETKPLSRLCLISNTIRPLGSRRGAPLGATTGTERATLIQMHCVLSVWHSFFGLHVVTFNFGSEPTARPSHVRQLNTTASQTSAIFAVHPSSLRDGRPLVS